MALLAEVLVEEWLNRQGYFTIRGIKIGVHEMDLLAIRPRADGTLECRHVEVQASVNPVSYLTPLSQADCKATGRKPTSSKVRSAEEMARGVREWVQKKFGREDKGSMLTKLAPGPWTRELVLHRLKHPEELEEIKGNGVTVHRLSDVIQDMRSGKLPVTKAAGSDFMDLLFLEEGTDLPGYVPSEADMSAEPCPGINCAHMLIKVNQGYTSDMSSDDLYESTRKSWKVAPKRARKARYALSVSFGIVRAVYRINDWSPSSDGSGRWEFQGESCEDLPNVIGTSVRHMFRQGQANPIKYVNC